MIDAIERASGRPVSRETFDRLGRYVDLLRTASSEHNLIAASTLDAIWDRHVVDSAQLVRFETRVGASWVDIGSGAGLPGVVIALLTEGPITLVEPRRLRAEFLADAVDRLGLRHRVTVLGLPISNLCGQFDMITARALAPLPKLLEMARHVSRPDTIWVLPKGRTAKSELAEAQRSWHCNVRTEASCTDPAASILVLSRVGRQ